MIIPYEPRNKYMQIGHLITLGHSQLRQINQVIRLESDLISWAILKFHQYVNYNQSAKSNYSIVRVYPLLKKRRVVLRER